MFLQCIYLLVVGVGGVTTTLFSFVLLEEKSGSLLLDFFFLTVALVLFLLAANRLRLVVRVNWLLSRVRKCSSRRRNSSSPIRGSRPLPGARLSLPGDKAARNVLAGK